MRTTKEQIKAAVIELIDAVTIDWSAHLPILFEVRFVAPGRGRIVLPHAGVNVDYCRMAGMREESKADKPDPSVSFEDFPMVPQPAHTLSG